MKEEEAEEEANLRLTFCPLNHVIILIKYSERAQGALPKGEDEHVVVAHSRDGRTDQKPAKVRAN